MSYKVRCEWTNFISYRSSSPFDSTEKKKQKRRKKKQKCWNGWIEIAFSLHPFQLFTTANVFWLIFFLFVRSLLLSSFLSFRFNFVRMTLKRLKWFWFGVKSSSDCSMFIPLHLVPEPSINYQFQCCIQ